MKNSVIFSLISDYACALALPYAICTFACVDSTKARRRRRRAKGCILSVNDPVSPSAHISERKKTPRRDKETGRCFISAHNSDVSKRWTRNERDL